MSLLVLGLSHHRTPFEILERVAADADAATAFERRALTGEHIREALVLSTCNRTEVYADTLTFHGALTDLTTAFSESTDLPIDTLRPHLHVHYDDRAVAHVFAVASGLDSMAIGEEQVIGQLRGALSRAQGHGHLGHELNAVIQQALRVGKRIHTETDVDSVSSSLVDAGLQRATEVLGDLTGASVLVLGAGGMGALAATVCRRRGVGALTVANRTAARARSLAQRLGAAMVDWTDVDEALGSADIVITSTGAPGSIVSAEAVSRAGRGSAHPQVFIDLALPRDVDPAVQSLPGVTVLGLRQLGDLLAETGAAPEVQAARDLVTLEVAAFLADRSAQSVAPTVRALRAGAQQILAAELARLERRTAGLHPVHRAEVEKAMRRVVDKLLHTPTVRVKELAGRGQGGSYARALTELFDLDPDVVSTVSAPVGLPLVPDPSARPARPVESTGGVS